MLLPLTLPVPGNALIEQIYAPRRCFVPNNQNLLNGVTHQVYQPNACPPYPSACGTNLGYLRDCLSLCRCKALKARERCRRIRVQLLKGRTAFQAKRNAASQLNNQSRSATASS